MDAYFNIEQLVCKRDANASMNRFFSHIHNPLRKQIDKMVSKDVQSEIAIGTEHKISMATWIQVRREIKSAMLNKLGIARVLLDTH